MESVPDPYRYYSKEQILLIAQPILLFTTCEQGTSHRRQSEKQLRRKVIVTM